MTDDTNQKITKSEHYVPKFYLKNFSAGSEQVYVYDIDRAKIYLGNIKDICVENYFYESRYNHETHGSQFIQPNKHENAFSSLEGEYAPLIREVIRDTHLALSQHIEFQLDEERKSKIAQFAAHLFFRNKWIVNRHLNGENGIEAMAELMEKDNELKASLELSRLMGVPDAAIAKSVSFEALFDSLSTLFTRGFEQLESTLIIAPPNSEFLTSSCPVYFDLYDDEDNITQIKCAFLPLSPKLTVLFYGTPFSNKPKHQGIVGEGIVDFLNREYVKLDAVDKLISKNKSLLDSIKGSWENDSRRNRSHSLGS